MLSFRPYIFIGALSAALVWALYEKSVISSQREQLAAQERKSLQQTDAFRILSERLKAAEKPLLPESPTAARPIDDPAAANVRAALKRVEDLKAKLAYFPQEKIPEFQYLTDYDWLVAAESKNPRSPDDYRSVLAFLRDAAKKRFFPVLQTALKKYLDAFQGISPTDVSQLAPYFDPPVDPALFNRYEMIPQKPPEDLEFSFFGGPDLIKERASAIVDPDYDTIVTLNRDGTKTPRSELMKNAVKELPEMSTAQWNFRKAHLGSEPLNFVDLLPYFKSPESAEKARKYFETMNAQPADVPKED